MNRRKFLTTAAMATTGAALFSRKAWMAELPRDLRVTRVVGFDLLTKRPKFVGKNSRLDNHGDSARDRMVRICTNAGIEGLGNCRAGEDSAAALLGKDPFDFFDRESRRMTGPLGAGTMPLWDLAGKVLEKPAHELLGGAGPKRVPCYDGSIYFADLLPQYEDNWRQRFRDEIDLGLRRGHRGFKVKVGRGAKWMPREEGDARDVEVLKVIREHAGPDVLIGIDANNGYDLPRTKRLLEQVGDLRLAFLEEMFPENVEQYLELKEFMRKAGIDSLIADGETQGDLDAFPPLMKADAVDIYQADMNRFGFEGILEEAAMAKPHGQTVAPHNWGSLVGFYMQLHVGRAITNFYRAENDPLDSNVLIAEGYEIKDGFCTVPAVPGFGLKLDENRFEEECQVRFDLRA